MCCRQSENGFETTEGLLYQWRIQRGRAVSAPLGRRTDAVVVPTISENGRPTAGLSNLSAMAGRIDFILCVAGHYAISAAVKMFEREL